MAARTLLLRGLLTLLLLVGVSAQSCQDKARDTYPRDFASGTADRYLYDNIAPGAECQSVIPTDQTEEERCNEYLANIPDDDWISYPAHYLPGEDDLILTMRNYSQYLGGLDYFPQDICIAACRIRPWCKSVDWSYGYDKCKLSSGHGRQVPGEDWITYIEKPSCPNNQAPNRNSSLSYFRLALKLAAIGRYDIALDRMMKALQADKWNKMNNWGVALMTLFAGEFSEASITEARLVMNSLSSSEYPASTAGENAYLSALTDSLNAPNVPLAIAQAFETRYNNAPNDLLAAVIAAGAYDAAGDMSKHKSIMEAVLTKDPANLFGLYGYLAVYAFEPEVLFAQDDDTKDKIRIYIATLVSEDPNSPTARMQALLTSFYLQDFAGTYTASRAGLGVLEPAYDNGLITDVELITMMAYMYSLGHSASLYRNDITKAQELEVEVDGLANSAEFDLDTKAVFAALRYRMLSRRYAEFAFTETSGDLKALPEKDIGTITQIPSSDSLYTEGKLSQYMWRQAIVTQQLRNGSDVNYAQLVDNWEKLRDESALFDSTYANSVSFNLMLLKTEHALMQGNKWTEIFGASGYLNRASQYELDGLESTYILMNSDHIISYAIIKMSMTEPAPIGRLNQGNNLPSGLSFALYALQQAWPVNTPTRLNTIAFTQLALGQTADAQATLDLAAQSILTASIPWLQLALERVREVGEGVPVSELGNSQFVIPASYKFNQEDRIAWNGLDKDWSYRPQVSAMDPCTAFRVDSDSETNNWPMRSGESIMSANTAYYFSTNVESCKQRCLFESAFACKAFTFGFNRCLLHDQTWSEVAANKRLSSITDDNMYEVPACNEADFDTDAYSQLMLGVKGLSNSLLDFAESKFDKAIELDQLMGMPKIMKAYLLYLKNPCDITEATALLSERMQLTGYEAKMAKVVENIIMGEGQDALNFIEELKTDFPDDPLVRSLEDKLKGSSPANGELSIDIIQLIAEGVNPVENIANLRERSPLSPRADLLDVYQQYLAGSWDEIIDGVVSMEARTYVGFSDDSYAYMFAMQLKHFAYLQLGEYRKAKEMYTEYRGETELGAYMYAAEIYTQLTNENELTVADPGIIGESDPQCVDQAKAAAWSMYAARAFADDNLASSVQQERRNMALDNLPSSGDVRTIWIDVITTFFNLGKESAVTTATGISDSEDNLSPVLDIIDLGRGVQLVSTEELVAWATLAAQQRTKYEDVLDSLSGPNGAAPKRAVSLWLRYKILRDWRSVNDDKRDESLQAADDLLSQWSDGDRTTAYMDAKNYRDYPDEPDKQVVKFLGITNSANLPAWAIWTIIAVGALLVIALIVTVIVWLCVRDKRRREKNKKRLYSGSIHSASTAGPGGNVLPEHGEVMYGGMRNDGYTEDAAGMDFKN